MMTGLYPHHNGALGFDPIREGVPTLTGILRDSGYFTGIIGKVEHLQPQSKFCWDFCDDVYNSQNLHGRSPYIYYRDTVKFLEQAKASGKPFFYMANSHDPHRPFAGSEDELKRFYGYNTYASRYYKPEEIHVPGHLPDLPDVRKELAQYYSSVHRCDETVGSILRAFDEAGMTGDTMVIFLSDNGMAFPFAKANCYLNSTKTPFIARWPGNISAGSVNREDYITGIDFTPTILEAAGLTGKIKCDGRSYLSILKGGKQENRDTIFTQFNTTSAKKSFPMRCVQSRQFGYIYNAWADGEVLYMNEAKTGLTYRAMKEASTDPFIAARVKMFDYRCKEEFYDFTKDPDALDNLINDKSFEGKISEYRNMLRKYLEETEDPQMGPFMKDIFCN